MERGRKGECLNKCNKPKPNVVMARNCRSAKIRFGNVITKVLTSKMFTFLMLVRSISG